MLFVVSVAGGVLLCSHVKGQVLLSGTGYTETFDSIGQGLPPGWSVWTDATDASLGTAAVFETNTTSWAATAGDFRNCASVTNDSGVLATNATSSKQQSFANRVLAVRQGSSFGDPGAAFVLQIAKTTGLSNLQFSVDFMMLDEENRETAWTVDYGIGTSPGSFTVLGVYTNSGAPGTIVRPAYALGPDADDQPNVVTIRVVALDPSTASGSRDTFGLDNARVTFQGAGPTAVPLAIAKAGSTVVLTWGDPAFGLQAGPGMSGTFTNMPAAESPYTNAIGEDQMFFRLVK